MVYLARCFGWRYSLLHSGSDPNPEHPFPLIFEMPPQDTTMPSRGRTVYDVHIWALIGSNSMFTGLLCTIIYGELRWLNVMLSLILANCIAATWFFVPASARNPLVKQSSAISIILLVLNLNEYERIFEKCDTTTSTYRDYNYFTVANSSSTLHDLTTGPKTSITREQRLCSS